MSEVNYEQMATEFMERCDKNNDGVVEWKEVMELFGQNWDAEREAAEKVFFTQMDKNGDGKVDKAEFIEWAKANKDKCV